MIKIIHDSFDREEFNNVANHPLQTWQWGEARKQTGVGILRLGEYDNDVLSNVFILTIHKIPFFPFSIAYCPRSVMPSKSLLEFLENHFSNSNTIFVKFEPDVPLDNNQKKTSFLSHNSSLRESPHPLFPKWTQTIDLTKTEDELMERMKSKTRYNVRYARRKGVVVKEESDDIGFQKFLDLYFKTTDRQEYYGHNRKYHRIIWDNMKDGIARILIAYVKDTPVAAYELFHFKDTLYYPYGGSSSKYRNKQGSSLIMWEAIELGKKLGAKKFDMWGSLPPNYNQHEDWGGFTRFKEGYGTSFVEFIGSFDLVLKPLVYNMYNMAYILRQKYLEMRS